MLAYNVQPDGLQFVAIVTLGILAGQLTVAKFYGLTATLAEQAATRFLLANGNQYASRWCK